MKRKYLPLLILVLTLATLGILLFQHISLTKQTPIWDSFTYAQKAKNFWDAVQKFQFLEPQTWVSPLNIEPTTRPPGTILMSYPFGFSDNPDEFFFRSIFLPIILFVAALWIIAKPYCVTLKDQWLLVALCLAFATLPLFYHFEPSIDSRLSSPTYWGLVDNFIASVAALATALVIRGVQEASMRLTFAGIITSTFCLFIKPSGGLVMATIFFVWAIYAIVQYKWQRNISTRKYLILSVSTFFFVYVLGLLLSLTSHYFSTRNMVYGRNAVKILKQESIFDKDYLQVLIAQIHVSFGWHWLTFIFLSVIFSFWGISKQSNIKSFKALPVDLISALGVLLIGLWFWLLGTHQSQIRYFFPFALICIVLLFPRIKILCSEISHKYFKIMIFPLVFPMLLLLFLLTSNPPIELQRILGVNLTSGSLANEIKQAKSLLEDANKKKVDLNVYSVGTGYITGIFGGVGLYEKMLYPHLNSFNLQYPLNWITESTFRFSEILSSDYLLIDNPIKNQLEGINILKNTEVPDFAIETNLFHAWLSTINYDNAGLVVESETSLRLLKIIDNVKLEKALNELRSKYKWRQVFLNANPAKWINADAAKTLIDKSYPEFRDIGFSNQFILLGAFTKRTEDGLTIELVWQSLKDQPLKYFNFVHILDASQNIISQADYEQDDAKNMVTKGTIWHDTVKIKANQLNGAKAIGLGIYLPQSTLLVTDRGPSDWNKHRLLLNLDMNQSQ
ncbi:hypothetical protein A4S05_06655 [Nostoc sp. KVJ20]|uniref:hypothetical protein n=1 Tax=Nostoc sp. KVJ20 TaxID=457944 RepID=UPI00083D2DE1|nr:hypothetical protein [Nostoc sp. KVJ20]ODG99011.1 hypothetical protein A4S05_06655 [Nostoc sp. KVJ20]